MCWFNDKILIVLNLKLWKREDERFNSRFSYNEWIMLMIVGTIHWTLHMLEGRQCD